MLSAHIAKRYTSIGRNEPNLYMLCQLHALFSLLSISHDHLDALSSTVGCLSDPPINFESVMPPSVRGNASDLPLQSL